MTGASGARWCSCCAALWRRCFETAVRAVVPICHAGPAPVGQSLQALVRDEDGPALSRYAETRADERELRDLSRADTVSARLGMRPATTDPLTTEET